MKKLLINILLCVVAVLLFFPLYIINAIVVISGGGAASGFFRSTALSIDRYANYEFRALMNRTLIKPYAVHRFGDFTETISYVLAVNMRPETLTTTGIFLVWLIERIDKGHFEKTLKAYSDVSNLTG